MQAHIDAAGLGSIEGSAIAAFGCFLMGSQIKGRCWMVVVNPQLGVHLGRLALVMVKDGDISGLSIGAMANVEEL